MIRSYPRPLWSRGLKLLINLQNLFFHFLEYFPQCRLLVLQSTIRRPRMLCAKLAGYSAAEICPDSMFCQTEIKDYPWRDSPCLFTVKTCQTIFCSFYATSYQLSWLTNFLGTSSALKSAKSSDSDQNVQNYVWELHKRLLWTA